MKRPVSRLLLAALLPAAQAGAQTAARAGSVAAPAPIVGVAPDNATTLSGVSFSPTELSVPALSANSDIPAAPRPLAGQTVVAPPVLSIAAPLAQASLIAPAAEGALAARTDQAALAPPRTQEQSPSRSLESFAENLARPAKDQPAAQSSPSSWMLLARYFDGAAAQRPAATGHVPTEAGAASAPLPPRALAASGRPGNSRDPRAVEREIDAFLLRVGFDSGASEVAAALAKGGLAPEYEDVLRTAAGKTPAIDSARALAAKVMAGLAAQGFGAEAMEKGADLAARLLSLRGVRNLPTRLPEDAAGSEERAAAWMGAQAEEAMSPHLTALVSDILDTLYGPQDPRRAAPPAEEVASVRKLAHDVLFFLYADPDIAANRTAGRALAAALVRHARLNGTPGLERSLDDKLRARGLKLSDFVGDRIELTDRYGKIRVFQVRSGDIVGNLSRDLSASEITAGARPQWALWSKAWRQKLLGPVIGLWVDDRSEGPRVVAGQPVRNALRRALFKARRWLGGREYFLRGYSHTGMALVQESDGVALTWVLHNRIDSRHGGIRKDALMHEFLRPSHVRFGLSRLHPERARLDFLRQARENGYREEPYRVEDGAWKSALERPAYERLLALARGGDSESFLRELNALAIAEIERLRFSGQAYAKGYTDRLGHSQCISTLFLAYLLGAQFEIQDKPDQWHPLAILLQKLGLPNAQGLKMDQRIIWPGTFFVDPKVGLHQYAELPLPRASYEAELTERYEARDGALTAALAPLRADRAALERAIGEALRVRDLKRSGVGGWHNSLNDPWGYFAALERLWLRRNEGPTGR